VLEPEVALPYTLTITFVHGNQCPEAAVTPQTVLREKETSLFDGVFKQTTLIVCHGDPTRNELIAFN
jgi:hypothetical protein